MRFSDWSSDVCSSDRAVQIGRALRRPRRGRFANGHFWRIIATDRVPGDMMATEGLGSAFTTGGLVGQLAFLLLVLGAMTSRYKSARAFIAVAALNGLFHSLLWTGNNEAAFRLGLLMVASLTRLGR